MYAPDLLTEEGIIEGSLVLGQIDVDFAHIYTELGPPPLWRRTPGFPTLVHIILEQQVSLASARAAFSKLEQALGEVTPPAFMILNDDELKKIGFSRQKTRYCRELAKAIQSEQINLVELEKMDDPSARSALMHLKGIGRWTADIYLLMALLRPNIWPAGDLALAVAYQSLKQLPVRPDKTELEQIALTWQPWRAVAARLLWHFYLNQRNSF